MYGIFADITPRDVAVLIGCFILSRFAYEGIKRAWEWVTVGPKESCTQCHFKVRSNDRVVQNKIMLSHYEAAHPKLAFAARKKYGEKEES